VNLHLKEHIYSITSQVFQFNTGAGSATKDRDNNEPTERHLITSKGDKMKLPLGDARLSKLHQFKVK